MSCVKKGLKSYVYKIRYIIAFMMQLPCMCEVVSGEKQIYLGNLGGLRLLDWI